jgi:phage gp46-like protein
MNGDALLVWNPQLGIADLAIANGDIVTDAGLETAVLISLFTDRRASAGDALAAPQDDPRGWWGDMFPDVEGDYIGSRLWLLAREKNETPVATRAEEYAAEALQWMIEDRVVSGIGAVATQPGDGMLLLEIKIDRPGKQRTTFKYDLNWAAQEARRIA